MLPRIRDSGSSWRSITCAVWTFSHQWTYTNFGRLNIVVQILSVGSFPFDCRLAKGQSDKVPNDSFDYTRNCSQTALLYNRLSLSAPDSVPLLRSILLTSVNVTDANLETLLHSTTFVKNVLARAGKECNAQTCTSLNFPSNADIAGIGVCV